MHHRRRGGTLRHALAVLLLLPMGHAANEPWTVDFESTYTTTTGHEMRIRGVRPGFNAAGLPAFLWFMNTGDEFASPVDLDRLEAMASRGFVAVTIDYPNTHDQMECESIFNGGWKSEMKLMAKKAPEIIPPAISAVCALEQVNCSAGIAVSGHGQGGYLTQLAPKYNGGNNVTAIMPLSIGCEHSDLLSDFSDESVAPYLEKEKRLILIGKQDELFWEDCMQELSGASNFRTESEGIGWGYMLVPNAIESVGHSFYGEHDHAQEDSRMKCIYRNSSDRWALDATSDWLAEAASPAFSPCVTSFVESCDSPATYSHSCVDHSLGHVVHTWVPAPNCLIYTIVGGTGLVGLACCCSVVGILWCRRKRRCCFKGSKSTATVEVSVVPGQYEGRALRDGVQSG